MEPTEKKEESFSFMQTPKIDAELVDKLTNEYEALTKELNSKVYPVKLETEETVKKLLNFIESEASWKNMEALGIIEVHKVLTSELENGMKSGNIFLGSLPIQAISFFLAKTEGFGLRAAKQHILFVKPIEDALKLIKIDNDKLSKLQNELAAAENGIEIDGNGNTKE